MMGSKPLRLRRIVALEICKTCTLNASDLKNFLLISRQIPATKPYDPIATPEQASQQVGVDVPDEVADKKSVPDKSPIHPVTSAGVPKAQKKRFSSGQQSYTCIRPQGMTVQYSKGLAMPFGLRVTPFPIRVLRAAGLKGDVRFFFLQDRRNAKTVRSVVQSELGRRGYPIALKLLERDGRKFEFAAPGKIEVWLPPLPNSRS
jgi:hypothetical protein